MRYNFETFSVRVPGYAVALVIVAALLRELLKTIPLSIGDLGSFIESARAAAHGMNPYDVYPLGLQLSFPGFEFRNVNLNPPISVLIFRIFTLAEPTTTARLWYAFSFLSYLLLIRVMMRHFPEVPRYTVGLWMLALAAFWDTLHLGQIYIPLMAAGIFAWIHLRQGSHALAGILIGVLVSFKPQFALWPALLILARHLIPACWAFATSLLISVIPLLIYGVEIYQRWFTVLQDVTVRVPFLTNASLTGLLSRVNLSQTGLLLSLSIGAATAAWIAVKRPDAVRTSSYALVLTMLVSPLSWVHYSLVLTPLLLSRWQNESIRCSACALIVPVPLILSMLGQPDWIQFTIGSLYSWTLILLTTVLIKEEIFSTMHPTAISKSV